ncbi:hypothetical protein [Methylobacterium sp. ID0610]|uniref:hypothetical protein n=1 Tax=Methylobacterium carpenticola TaxID=3344827 RepID=UPI0036A65395
MESTITAMQAAKGTREPGGVLACVLLAMVAMAGPLYIDIMPSIVAALRAEFGLSATQAGFVAAANGYGSTAGALLALFVVPRLPWGLLATALLLALAAADVATTAARSYEALIGLRAVHGIVGGLLVGLAYSLIAQLRDPRQGFGILFVFHFGFGGIGVLVSVFLAPLMSHGIVFLILAAFDLLALFVVPLLPAFTQPGRSARAARAIDRPRGSGLARIAGLFLFQAANLGLGAFLIGLGADLGHAPAFASFAVGLGLGAGTLGAIAMLRLSGAFGWRPMIPVMLAAGLSKVLVGIGHDPVVFAVAVSAIFLTMAMALPYAFALCAAGDASGRSSVLAGFASKLGLSTGPAIGGLLYPLGPQVLIGAAIVTVAAATILFGLSLRGPLHHQRA